VTDDLVKRLNMADATMHPMTLVIVAREAKDRINEQIALIEDMKYERMILQRMSIEKSYRIEELEAALRGALNFIENTESELGITLSCGDIARAALGEKKDV